MAEIVSRHQAMAEAMAAEQQLVANEAAEAKPNGEVSAAARALRAAGLAKKQAVQHPKEAPVEAQEESPADEEETAAPADAEAEGDPSQDDEPAEQTIVVKGKRMTAEDFEREYVPKAEFTRKNMKEAEEARRFAAEAQQRLQRLDQQIQNLHSDIGQEPNWLEVAQKEGNDVAFSKKLEWDAKAAKLQAAIHVRREESQRLVAQAIAERDNDLAENYNTAWQDPKVRAQDYERIAQYAFEQGFTPEETALMTASRYLKTLDKARKFDEAVAAGKLAKPGLVKKPAVLKPSARNPQSTTKNPQLDKAMEQFNKNPTREGYLQVSQLSKVN